MPGPGESMAPTSVPRQSGPPWCGQRFRTARNSPPTLKMPIERPSTGTILRPPGGISPAVATTWLAKRCLGPPDRLQPVECAGIPAHDAAAQLASDHGRQCPCRRVEVPVRIVGREHDAVVHTKLVEQHLEVPLAGRLLDRLRGEPEARADRLRWRP